MTIKTLFTKQDYRLKNHHLGGLLFVLLQLFDYIRALFSHYLHMSVPEMNRTPAQWENAGNFKSAENVSSLVNWKEE